MGWEGLVYVIDSADPTRFAEAKNEFDWILVLDGMSGDSLGCNGKQARSPAGSHSF